jgi:hypothetical protein
MFEPQEQQRERDLSQHEPGQRHPMTQHSRQHHHSHLNVSDDFQQHQTPHIQQQQQHHQQQQKRQQQQQQQQPWYSEPGGVSDPTQGIPTPPGTVLDGLDELFFYPSSDASWLLSGGGGGQQGEGECDTGQGGEEGRAVGSWMMQYQSGP